MALNPSPPAATITTFYLNFVSQSPPVGRFPQPFATAYLNYSQQGVLSSGGGVSGSEDSLIITNFLRSIKDVGNTTVHNFATMFANYWATCLLIPAGGAISVTNDASSKVSAFESAINATLTDQDTKPYFLNLITNIQNIALPQITWTVTLPDPPYTRLETVS